jgi:hypothetical protein
MHARAIAIRETLNPELLDSDGSVKNLKHGNLFFPRQLGRVRFSGSLHAAGEILTNSCGTSFGGSLIHLTCNVCNVST